MVENSTKNHNQPHEDLPPYGSYGSNCPVKEPISPQSASLCSPGSCYTMLMDRYELSMVEAALKEQIADTLCTFEVFARRLLSGADRTSNAQAERIYGVFAGVGRLLDHLESFQFFPCCIEFLKSHNIVSAETLVWLKNYKFSGTIRGYREGELYFPSSPVLQVEGTFAQCILLETLILSVLNYDSAIATAADKMVDAAYGKPLVEMGSRRTFEHAAVAAARSAYIGGFSATSNLMAHNIWGVPSMGTVSHAWVLLNANETAAFRSQINTFGAKTTILLDTYNIEQAMQILIESAPKNLEAVRIDSGDIATQARTLRQMLDQNGFSATKIVATNNLDEDSIRNLARDGNVDIFGVGTSLVTALGNPTSDFVYKLTSKKVGGIWVSVSKNSVDKSYIPGKKYPYRKINKQGVATAETLFCNKDAIVSDPDHTLRPLCVDYVRGGTINQRYRGKQAVILAKEHLVSAKKELPTERNRSIPVEVIC